MNKTTNLKDPDKIIGATFALYAQFILFHTVFVDLVTILDPYGFRSSIRIEEILLAFDALCADGNLVVLAVGILSGSVFRPTLCGVRINGQFGAAVKYGSYLPRGGTSLELYLPPPPIMMPACCMAVLLFCR